MRLATFPGGICRAATNRSIGRFRRFQTILVWRQINHQASTAKNYIAWLLRNYASIPEISSNFDVYI
jgi:hypothetical protein